MACPVCGGESREPVAGTHWWRCTTPLERSKVGGLAADGSPLITRWREPCGNEYEKVSSTTPQIPFCDFCTTLMIGRCAECDKNVCGSDSFVVDRRRLCLECHEAHRVRGCVSVGDFLKAAHEQGLPNIRTWRFTYYCGSGDVVARDGRRKHGWSRTMVVEEDPKLVYDVQEQGWALDENTILTSRGSTVWIYKGGISETREFVNYGRTRPYEPPILEPLDLSSFDLGRYVLNYSAMEVAQRVGVDVSQFRKRSLDQAREDWQEQRSASRVPDDESWKVSATWRLVRDTLFAKASVNLIATERVKYSHRIGSDEYVRESRVAGRGLAMGLTRAGSYEPQSREIFVDESGELWLSNPGDVTHWLASDSDEPKDKPNWNAIIAETLGFIVRYHGYSS